jgi:hypothetical protein
MSRRRGEFEHRTTIFEGAFRAWSHLGGLDPEELETKASSDLDPLTNPIVHDTRLTGRHLQTNPDGSTRREYPYEPLPRAGLSHPFVQVCVVLCYAVFVVFVSIFASFCFCVCLYSKPRYLL